MSAFHTGSIAEFHDYQLRHLLVKYSKALTGSNHDKCEKIFTNNAAYSLAVRKYKHVVTHFLAAKMEIWMSLFMYPVYGFKNGNLSIEFATQRGGIHFHTPGALKNRIIPLIADALMFKLSTEKWNS